MDKTWKKIERKVADILGGVRVPVTGRQRGDAPDVLHRLWSIEVKHRKALPEWLFDAMEQAEESKKSAQTPIVILHQKGQAVIESFTVLRLSDILLLQQRIEDLEEQVSDLEHQIKFGG